MPSRFPFIVAFVSGLCALVYEIVWMRAFTPVFGLSVYATTAVLTAFMGGLGLGSQFAPAVIERWGRSPWMLYALLEVAIGLAAVIVPLAPPGIAAAYTSVAGLDAAGFATASVRFALSFAVMLVPTFFMGLTLPVLAQACRSEFGEHRLRSDRIGLLYGLNTVGGAVGCVLVGFVLLHPLGVLRTAVVTALVNLAVAALVIAFARRSGRTEHAAAPLSEAPTPVSTAGSLPAGGPAFGASRGQVLALYALLGAIAFGYELCWFRILIFYLQSATYSFSLMLTLFLLGLGLGSTIHSRLLAGRALSARQAGRDLAFLQMMIALFGVLTLHVYTAIPAIWSGMVGAVGAGSWLSLLAQKAVVASLIIVPPTALMGASFPLVARLYKGDEGESDARSLSRLYASNTAGSIAGSLLTGFVLFDAIGVQNSLLLFALVGTVIAAWLAFASARGKREERQERAERDWEISWAASLAGFGALVLAIGFTTEPRLLVKNFERHMGDVEFYRESAGDITYVYRTGDMLALGFSDGRGTASTGFVSNQVNRLLAYTAMLVKPDAKDVLVISMGCGNTAAAFAKFPIERLDIVDISSGAFEAAHLFPTNDGVLDDPRVHWHVEDGRNFLLKSQRKYDVIELELPTLHTDGVVFLYTKEFYEIARSRLKPGGVLSQWIDANQTGAQASHELIATMLEEFPDTSVWTSEWAWWAIGTNGEGRAEIDWPAARAHFASGPVRADATNLQLGFEHALSTLVAYGEPLRRTVAGGEPIVDDRTRLDFEVPRLAIASALGGGLAYYNSPLRTIFEDSWQEGELQTGTERFYPGSPDEHHALVDASLRDFARDLDPAVVERVARTNGAR